MKCALLTENKIFKVCENSQMGDNDFVWETDARC